MHFADALLFLIAAILLMMIGALVYAVDSNQGDYQEYEAMCNEMGGDVIPINEAYRCVENLPRIIIDGFEHD